MTLLPPRMFCIAPTTVTENMSAISHLVHLTMQPCVPKYLSHPCQLLVPTHNAEQRSGQTTHHTATRSIQTRKRTSETRSQGTARLSTPRKKNRHTLLGPYPTTVSHQQFRTQVGSHNTPYTAKHSIQTRKRATEICSQRTARNFSTPHKTPVLLCGDPTQLLFPINNSDHR